MSKVTVKKTAEAYFWITFGSILYAVGFDWFFFENGKVARVALSAYQTQTRRKKLTGAYSDKSPLAAACLLLSVSVYPATAATSMSSLQNKLDKLSQSIVQHKKELSNAKKKEQAAKALESELKEKVTVVQSQISVLKGQIAEVQNSIGLKEQEIAAKEQQITEKEAEIADQWGDFKQHMAAMQELRDGGSVAMLSAVNDLYELLTFNEVMQDISIKDTEILDNMKNAKEALESDKLTLESQRSELQSKKADLDAQNSQMRAKQNELNSSVAAAQMSAAEAQQAQKDAQAAIESDEMNYEAVKKQIQKMIAAAAASKPTLSFTGFICPLKSYSRISSEYGWRKNPVSGVNKLHAGIDLAAGGGTPIYAAASGYVQVAGWSSGGYGNYVIIYHGKMSDGNQYSTLYGHMRSVATSAGKYVQQGEIIGYVGSTGNSTGNHLHLEVWKGGSKANAVNPRGYIPMK